MIPIDLIMRNLLDEPTTSGQVTVRLNDKPLEIRVEKVPATCPVCQGRGHHYFGFYLDEQANTHFTAAGPHTTKCRTCLGSGMVQV